jgi:hypothetical protein
MVKTAVTALVLATLSTAAHARPVLDDDYEEPPPPEDYDDGDDDDDSPAFNMFGFTMGIGSLPVQGASTLAMSIGLSVEHPVFKKTRVLGEYDWMWLMRRDTRANERLASADSMVPRPEEHATGHRAGLGLRRELIGKGNYRSRLFLDGELGGSIALVNNNMTGVAVVPALFTGVRVGYDLYSGRDDSPSRTFETAILLRAIALREGLGMMFGLGMVWGN